jgi:hypothetical protein
MTLYANYGQVLRTTANRKTGYIIGEIPLSIYTPSETDILGYIS